MYVFSTLHSFHSVSEIAVTFRGLKTAPNKDACVCILAVLPYLFLLCFPFITASASALSLACCLPTFPLLLFLFTTPCLFFSASIIFTSQHLPRLCIPLHTSQYQRALFILLYAEDKMLEMLIWPQDLSTKKSWRHSLKRMQLQALYTNPSSSWPQICSVFAVHEIELPGKPWKKWELLYL